MRTVNWLNAHFRLVIAAAITLGITPAYLHAYSIGPGGVSEVPSILPGDVVIVNMAAYDLRLPYSNLKLLHTHSPERGEMVLIVVPTSGWSAPKRVIGVPGDTVELRENRVFINGEAAHIANLSHSSFAWVPETDKLGTVVQSEAEHWISYTPGKGKYRTRPPMQLAAGQYFLLGDNRDESADSRSWGPLPEDLIVGKILTVVPTGYRIRR